MDNLTTEKKKNQVSDSLRFLADIVSDLEEVGVGIIHATASKEPYILISRAKAEFRVWALQNDLSVTLEPAEITEPDYGIRWKIGTVARGVDIHGYLTDAEKEAWDGEAV